MDTRPLVLLALTFIGTGALWSGVDDIDPLIGGLIGAGIFAVLTGSIHLGKFFTQRISDTT